MFNLIKKGNDLKVKRSRNEMFNLITKDNDFRIKPEKIMTYIVLIAIAIYTIFPIGFLLINSLKGQAEIINKPMGLPSYWNFDYIINAMKEINFIRAILITGFITIIAVTVLVIISSLLAWVMVRNKSKLSSVIFLMFTAAMLVPFQSVMYPLLSLFEKIGLKNIYGLIIMYCGFGTSMSVFLYHGFIKSIPKSIEEAAFIDGANIFQVYFKVVFPLLKSTTITVIILNAMWIWNDYLLPFLVIGNSKVKTLTLELYFAKMVSGQYGDPWELIFPAVLVSIIPIIIIYICLQKHIVKGVAAGAVKE